MPESDLSPSAETAAPAPDAPRPNVVPPSRLQFVLVGAVCLMTFLWWGGAKLVCNYHPFQAHPPEAMGTTKIARDAKHAAIEFQHRIATCNFEGALELSSGLAAERVKELRGSSSNEHCNERRKFAPAVHTFGELLTREGNGAQAQVHSSFHGAEEKFLVNLEYDREAGIWKVVSREQK